MSVRPWVLSLPLDLPQIDLKAFPCTWRLYLESRARLSELAPWPGVGGCVRQVWGCCWGGTENPTAVTAAVV